MLERRPACMARPLSRDLREQVVRAVEGGLSRRKAAAVFEVGIATVIEWVRVWRESGRLMPKPMGGDHRSRLKEERAWLLERIAAAPDLTLEEIRSELAARGKSVGYGTVWRFFASEDISFKKKSYMPASRSDLMWRRRAPSGRPSSPRSIRPVWCSSTKPGPRPTWRGHAGAPNAASVSSVGFLGGIGRS